jgi:hypothetical protein
MLSLKVIAALFLIPSFFVALAWTATAKMEKAPYATYSSEVSSHDGPPIENIYSQWGLDEAEWMQVGSAITPISRAASGRLGNYVYCFGGISGNVGQAYNITTQSWEMSTPPLLGERGWRGVTVNDNIYIVGRFFPPDGSGGEVQKFTPTGGGPTGTWELVAPYPLPLYSIAADWDGENYIYAAGGTHAASSTSFSAAYRYNIAANVWEPIASMPTAMTTAGGAFCQGRFYVMGGTRTGMGATNYEYDPTTNTWATRAQIPYPVFFGLYSFTQNESYVLSIGGGGGYGPWPATNAVQIYDPATDTWTQETPLPNVWGQNTGIWIDGVGHVLSAGGYDGTFYHTETYLGTDFFIGVGEPGAPAAVSGFTVENNGATVMASLSWTNPTTTVNGGALSSIDSVIIERNGSFLIAFTGVTPGQVMSHNDATMGTAGMYYYMIVCSNDSGRGNPANVGAWIGTDVPHDVNNLLLTPAPNYQLSATLTWINPTLGAHGGFCPGVAGYTIMRESDEGYSATFDYTGQHTGYIDNTILDPDYYWYTVIPYNTAGNGIPATSNTVYIGVPETWIWEQIPYVWNDISSVGTNAGLTLDDQNIGPFPLGFEFQFFNEHTFNTIRLCSNGWQSFTSTVINPTGMPIPTASEPNNLIASLWDDLDFSRGGICYYYADSVAQTFTVQYTNVPYFEGGGTATFQTILNCIYGTITCYYHTVAQNNYLCVGLENAPGTEGVQVFYQGEGHFIPANNTAIRFRPPGIPPTGVLEGHVYENATPSQPIEGAMVVILADTGYTNAAGFYCIESAYEGTHNATASNFGYNSVSESVTIIDDSTTVQDFFLPQPIISVDVTSISAAIPANTPYEDDFNITNLGDGTLDFEIVLAIPGGGTWASADPDEETIEPGESELITVSFLMPDTAHAGDVYNAVLIIDNNTVTPQVTILMEVTIVSDIEGSEAPIPLETALYQNYPNPFNPMTSISFDLHQRSHVVLEVFNVLGQKVATVVDRILDAGQWSATFDAAKLASGVYFYRFQANDFIDMKKMVLVR